MRRTADGRGSSPRHGFPARGCNNTITKMNTTQNLVALSDAQRRVADELDVLAASGLACRDLKAGFSRALLTAVCVERLKGALSEQVMQPIMALQDSALGFRTDREKQGGYPVPVVRDALINAVMCGLLPCGNQWNIIGGRMYVTKEGFTYLLDQAGVRYTIDQAVPVMKNGGAVVHTELSWSDPVSGSEGKKTLEIPVRVNAGMGADAILGKADRKAKCWLYNNLTHSTLADGEAEAAPARALAAPAAEAPSFLAQPPVALPGSVPGALSDAKADVLPGLEAQEAAPVFGQAYRD